jgi:N-acetylglucosaminyl-diphospho-decaprenol L-rhamnosyltransferase
MPRVSVIVVVFDPAECLVECLRCLEAQSYTDFEVVIVDNVPGRSLSPLLEDLRFPARVVAADRNLGYAGGNNLGARCATGELLAILNPDAFPEPRWLEAMVGANERAKGRAIIACKIFKAEVETLLLDSAGGHIEFPVGDAPCRGYLSDDRGQFDQACDVAYASGAAFLIPRRVFQAAAGFDESYFMYHEETDLCWRARLLGYRVIYEPRAVARHRGAPVGSPGSLTKLRLQTRNRMATNLKNLCAGNLALALLHEAPNAVCIGGGGMLSRRYRGFSRAYFQGLADALARLPRTLTTRRSIQARRVVPDRLALELHRRVGLVERSRRYCKLLVHARMHLFAEPQPSNLE